MKKEETVGLLASAPLQPNMVSVLHNLGRMLRDSHRLHLIMGDESLPKPLTGLFETIRIKPPTVNVHGVGFAFKASYKYLRSYQPDTIMNVSQPYPLGAAVALLGPLFNVRTLVRVTGNYMDEKKLARSYIKYAYRHIYHNRILNHIYKRSDITLPIGENIANDLISNGFKPDKVKVRPQPFDAEKFSTTCDKTEAKRKIGLNTTKKTLLFVGRVSWGKGADRLIKIIDIVTDQNTNFQFCVVGQGEFVDHIESYDNEKAISVGPVKRENIHKYYEAADLFVYPTRKDGLPNVILEAIAARVPVVSSPVAEIPNYVTHTYENVNDFVNYILTDDWKADDIPKWFNWEYQKNEYRQLLTN